MSYEEPPRCATCGHRAEIHEGWFSSRPKACSQFSPGGRGKCQCKKYVKGEA